MMKTELILVLSWLVWTGAAVGQDEKIIWSKQDIDPSLNVAFSAAGSMLALGREDSNTSDLLNANNGDLIRTLSGNYNTTNAIVFTSDDQYLINGVGGGGSTLTLDLWRVSDGVRLIRTAAHNNGTNSVSLSSDGQYLATSGHYSREIKIWQVPDQALIRTISNDDEASLNYPPRVRDFAFSPDGQLIGSSDIFAIKLRRAADGALVLRIPTGTVNSIAFSPGGACIAGVLENEHAVKIWRVSDGALFLALTIDGTIEYPRIAFSPDGTMIAAVYGLPDSTGAIQFWRFKDGQPLAFLSKPNHVHAIAFSPQPGVLCVHRIQWARDGRILAGNFWSACRAIVTQHSTSRFQPLTNAFL